MVQKSTAVWLIILTILVCSAVPAVLIWLTAGTAAARMLTGFELLDKHQLLVLPLADYTMTIMM